MKSFLGVDIGVCPVCNKEHLVRKAYVCGGSIYVVDAHRVSADSEWCRGEGLAPKQVFRGLA